MFSVYCSQLGEAVVVTRSLRFDLEPILRTNFVKIDLKLHADPKLMKESGIFFVLNEYFIKNQYIL